MAYSPAGKEIIIDISSELPAADWPECCIYMVPKLLRKVNEEAYTPKLISIGPFHCNREELWDMEIFKQRYLKNFLDRTGKRQEDLRKIIEDDEKRIRHCYSEDCSLNSGKFVKMILLDAIFIIELFLKVRDKKNRENEEKGQRKDKNAEEEEEEEDYILRKIWLANGIYYDLLLLENQLPFFVLEKLYKFACNDSSSCNHREEGKQIGKHKKDLEKEDAPFVMLFRNYFTYYDQKRKPIGQEAIEEPTSEEKTERPIREEVKHFTDLLRYLFCPQVMEKRWVLKKARWSNERGCMDSSKKNKKRYSGTQLCATKLNDAGLKFKVKDDTCLVDITVSNVSHVTLYTCLVKDDTKKPGCLVRFFACLIYLMCFPLICLLRCFGFPMHILQVSQLVIDYGTETIFRNLMALEQCHYPSKTYICSYVLLLDRLIDTVKDVDLLVDKKVIVNHLGSNAEVADLINKLGDQIVATTSSYFDIIAEKLNDHYEFPLNHLLATLKSEYFPNIFRGTATIVGLIVLGFTLWNFLRPYVM